MTTNELAQLQAQLGSISHVLASLQEESKAHGRSLAEIREAQAEDRGQKMGQADTWEALRSVPPKLLVVEARVEANMQRLDTIDKGGAGLDRLIGPDGFFRTWYFVCLVVMTGLSVGALQIDTVERALNAYKGTDGAPSAVFPPSAVSTMEGESYEPL